MRSTAVSFSLTRSGRGYQRREDELQFIRGKLLMAPLAHALLRSSLAVPCEFDDFTADIPENQILCFAVDILLRHPRVAETARPMLRRARVRLDGVSPVPRGTADIATFRYDRLNEGYRPLHQLAALLLDGMGLDHATGRFLAGTFLVDMNALFEMFVASWLRQRLAPDLALDTQVHRNLDLDETVAIRPDMTIRHEGRAILVADTKYKATSENNADVYQALAYCRALGIEKALLLYPGLPSSRRSVRVSDGANVIVIDAVDLTGTPAEIEASLEGIAVRIQQLTVTERPEQAGPRTGEPA